MVLDFPYLHFIRINHVVMKKRILTPNLVSSFCMFICLGLFIQCTTTNNATSSASPKSADKVSQQTLDNPANRTLADLLRTTPGINITGSGANIEVTIRGAKALDRGNAPLYVIDKTPVGRDYNSVANSINVENIASIRVVKGPQASMYGSRGAFGVIEIKTKK